MQGLFIIIKCVICNYDFGIFGEDVTFRFSLACLIWQLLDFAENNAKPLQKCDEDNAIISLILPFLKCHFCMLMFSLLCASCILASSV